MSLAGKTIVITGANGGIGGACVQLALDEGAQVFATDLVLTRIQPQLESKYDSSRLAFGQCDISSELAVEALFEDVVKTFGKLDSAVLNAGLSMPGGWLESTADHVDKQHAVNVRGPWLSAKFAVKAMLRNPGGSKGGNLVFISSIASIYGHPGLSGYTSSKWGVRGLSLTAAQEFAPHGIRSNCVQPGATDTPMIKPWLDSMGDEERKALISLNTLGRMADPMELAQVIIFLASDKASFVNGATIAVHAGQTPT